MAIREILIDTNAYAAYKRGLPEAVALVRHAPFIGINIVVLGELLGGFAAGTREEQNKQELQRFLHMNGVTIIPSDYSTAVQYATIYQTLKRQGTPIPTNDMWIAATALQHHLALFSYDKHFQSIPELVLGSSLEDLSE